MLLGMIFDREFQDFTLGVVSTPLLVCRGRVGEPAPKEVLATVRDS